MIIVISCLFILLIVPLIILILYQKYSRFFQLLEKIPGEKKYPVIGHFFSLTAQTPENHFLTERQLAKDHGPIYHQTLLNYGAVNILTPEDVEVVLSSTVLIKKSPIYDLLQCWLGTGLLTSFGQKWKQRRKLLTQTFHFSILQDYVQIFNDSTQSLVENLAQISKNGNGCVEIIKPITSCTLSSIAETSMGIKLNTKMSINNEYRQAVHDMGINARERMVRPWLYQDFIYYLTPHAYRTRQIVKTLHKFSESIIQERKKSFSLDSYAANKKMAMLDLLVTAQANGENINDKGIREEVDTFMFEGHDTTSVAITFLLLLLANNQKYQEDARQEIIEVLGDDPAKTPSYSQLQDLPLTERCIKESLRLYPSVPFIARDTIEEFTTATGYVVPKGTFIHIHIYDLHRLPHIWPEPEKYNPDRFLLENIKDRHPFAYVPFSAGPRNCIGQKFGMLELKAVLCGVLRQFYLEPIDRPEDVVFIKDLILRPKGEIRVKFLKRSPGDKFDDRFKK